jgi:dimethylaniline monooxygenase (N-oxide forming)
VVGMGESAVDVAFTASKVATTTTIWHRKMPDMPPRFITEFISNKDYDEVEFLATGQDHLLPKDNLEAITTSRIARNLPLGIWSLCLHGFVNDMKKLHGAKDTPGAMICDIHEATWQRDYFSSDTAYVPTKSGVLFGPATRGELDLAMAPELSCQGTQVTFHRPIFYGHELTKDATDPITIDVDVIVSCTGYKIAFPWLKAPVAPRARTWFKHCFPPNMGQHMAFLGYARPHQGGIPQVSEMLARYIAQLRIGNLQLPANYADLAIRDGNTERECFHFSQFELLVDYYAMMMSVANLIGCTPKMPPVTDIHGLVKHWTFPLWPCFFRTQGPGANLNAYHAVVDQFGPYDGLGPMPLLAVEIVFTFLMPFVNLFSYLLGFLLDFGKQTTLPRAYRWRMSKSLFLYSGLREFDFLFAIGQLIAGVAMVVHLISPPRFVAAEPQQGGDKEMEKNKAASS